MLFRSFDGFEDGSGYCGSCDCKEGCESHDSGRAKRKARILHASTDWLEERDPHGLERFEGTKNVSFVELESFGVSESVSHLIIHLNLSSIC